ncbi:MAG: hypothetical protein HY928_15565 [Elusimicrobia bacterium]|nr:hypothetical protein [Elusimicrobiota bacterium]
MSATDTYGLQKFVLSGPTSATQPVSGLTATHTFSSLAANSTTPYVVAVHDLAGNVSSAQFNIDTDPADDLPAVPSGGGSFSGGWITNDKCAVFRARDTGSGVKSMCVSCSPQKCAEYSVGPSTALFAGAFCNLGLGTCTQTITDLAGNTTNYYRTVSSTTIQFVHSVSSPGWSSGDVAVTVTTTAVASQALSVHAVIVGLGAGTCNGSTQDAWCAKIRTTGNGAVWPCACASDGASVASSMTFSAPATSVSYHAENAGSTSGGDHLRFTTGGLGVAQIEYNNFGWEPGHYVDGVVTVPEVAGTTWTSVNSDPLYVYAPLGNIDIHDSAALTAPQEGARLKQVLRLSSPRVYTLDPDGQTVVTTTFTVKFQYPDGVGTDTDTLRVYWFDGSSWSTDLFSGLSIAKDTSNYVTAIVQSTFTGVYAAFFDGVDSSAPVTSWAVEGSSSGFQGIVILSTYSYFVLSSTDPSVNGYASGAATTYYRIDGLPGEPYSAYSSSLSVLPGTHWVDYYAVDWAGNSESVSRATITVTAGSVTKLSSDLQVDGNLLVGFLGSGAKAEVVARSEYDYALKVSSPDGRAMLAVDNANFVSIGTAPASGRLTLQGVSGDAALALRTGNSTASLTGAQIALGYDGSGQLRHALVTQHGSAAYNNRLEFDLWSPDSSSGSLAGVRGLSLQGSTKTAAGALVEVRPVDITGDPADAELEVSNGVAHGAGYVLRADVITLSSRGFKRDIHRLTRKDEEQAYKDIAALMPAVFRRKRRGMDGSLHSDPSAALERGLIYEETPQSIRGRPGEIIYDERLVNAELALKAAMRRIEELSARLKRLKEQGR